MNPTFPRSTFPAISHGLDHNERYTLNHLQEALSFRPLAPKDADLETFQTISHALSSRRALKFNYQANSSRAPAAFIRIT